MAIKRLFLLVALLGLPGFAGDLVVIANPGLPMSQISGDDLRAIFLATKTSLKDGHRVLPVLHKPGSAMAEFSAEYLGKTEAALRTYYRSLVFTGKWSMPVALGSDAEVVAYVAATRGAIGFVKDTAVAQGVKALKVK
jgi:ABC-type phosphate transport system substrate-binding protein